MNRIPGAWTLARLDEIAEITQGQSPPGSSYNSEAHGVPFFQGKAEFGDLYPTVAKWTTEPKKHANKGDVLLSVRAPVGPTNLAPVDCAIGRGLVALRPHLGVHHKYLLYALRASEDRLAARATGTTFSAVTGAQVRSHEIAVAPTAEQQRIVDEIEEQFSRLDAGIKSLARARKRLERYPRLSIRLALEGDWRTVSWGEAGSSQNGRAFPSKDYSDHGIRLLRPGNLYKSGRVQWTDSNTRFLPEEYAERYPGYVVGPQELVMNLTAQSLKDEFLGRVCMTGATDRCLLNQRIARLTPSPALLPKFALWVFKSSTFRSFVDSLNTGSLIQHMFTSQLERFEIPLPPIREQERILEHIEQELSVVEAVDETLTAAEIKSAALRRAVLLDALAEPPNATKNPRASERIPQGT